MLFLHHYPHHIQQKHHLQHHYCLSPNVRHRDLYKDNDASNLSHRSNNIAIISNSENIRTDPSEATIERGCPSIDNLKGYRLPAPITRNLEEESYI